MIRHHFKALATRLKHFVQGAFDICLHVILIITVMVPLQEVIQSNVLSIKCAVYK